MDMELNCSTQMVHGLFWRMEVSQLGETQPEVVIQVQWRRNSCPAWFVCLRPWAHFLP